MMPVFRVRARWSQTNKTPWGEVEAPNAWRAAEALAAAWRELDPHAHIDGIEVIPMEVTLKGRVFVRRFHVEVWSDGCEAYELCGSLG